MCAICNVILELKVKVEGDFVPLRSLGHLTVSGDIFDRHSCGSVRGIGIGCLVGRVQGYRTAQQLGGVKVCELCFELLNHVLTDGYW